MPHKHSDSDLKLVVQTKTQNIKEEARIINGLFTEGLQQLNLYKPGYSYNEMHKFIDKIDAAYHPLITLYSHYGLVRKFDVGGVHIGRKSLDGFFSKLYWNYVLGRKKVEISTTVHSVRSIAHCGNEFDEILLGPVFINSGNEISNMSYKREIFERGIEKSKNNVIVMGGVSEKNLSYLKSLDIKGVLLHSPIWDAIDPVKAYARFRDLNRSTVMA